MNPSINESQRKRPARLFVPKPEYGDSKDVRIQFGIRGTKLYELWKGGDIKSIVIKAKGKDRHSEAPGDFGDARHHALARRGIRQVPSACLILRRDQKPYSTLQ
jgi:hypothetical protein